jgi:Zn/Cd-binding protein ZinT
LAEWAGTWNPVVGYLDDKGLDASFEAQYAALPAAAKTALFTSADVLRDWTKETVNKTDFGTFVIQGNTITFYNQNPSWYVIETAAYTFKEILSDLWQGEAFKWFAFEGDKEGAHKYLLLEEAGRDSPDGPLHFHMRYGGISFDDLLITSNKYGQWAPTIVSSDTTISELQVFMSLD